jgi:uncharacterized YigZ family protein
MIGDSKKVDLYNTIEEISTIDFKEKSSKFIAFAFPILSEIEANEKIEILWKQHPKATHICYAYRIGAMGEVYKINDDGEPSGTAGKPILGQIMSANLTFILVAVVRYFGGTKLGTSGLIQAYKDAAKQVLDTAHKVEKYIFDVYKLEFNYDKMGEILNEAKSLNLIIAGKDFNENPSIIISLRQSTSSDIIKKLKAGLLKIDLERINEETIVPFCKIEKIN